MPLRWTVHESPLGPLTLLGGRAGLAAVRFTDATAALDERARDPRALASAAAQLDDYFAGALRAFDVALDCVGSPFERAVWAALATIPYGATTTYARLTAVVGRDGNDYAQVRRVAAAIARTPAPIVIPCHRVVGADGSLVGYGGGLERKRALLDLEASVAAGRAPEPAWAFRQLTLG
jgi:methylated-DNA-[protein]-cysteine S-methyltransferase